MHTITRTAAAIMTVALLGCSEEAGPVEQDVARFDEPELTELARRCDRGTMTACTEVVDRLGELGVSREERWLRYLSACRMDIGDVRACDKALAMADGPCAGQDRRAIAWLRCQTGDPSIDREACLDDARRQLLLWEASADCRAWEATFPDP